MREGIERRFRPCGGGALPFRLWRRRRGARARGRRAHRRRDLDLGLRVAGRPDLSDAPPGTAFSITAGGLLAWGNDHALALTSENAGAFDAHAHLRGEPIEPGTTSLAAHLLEWTLPLIDGSAEDDLIVVQYEATGADPRYRLPARALRPERSP